MTADAIDAAPQVLVRSHLGWPIALALVLFVPFGLAAAFYGVRTARALDEGDLAVAWRSSVVARRWLIAAYVVGGVVDLLIMVVLGLLGAFPAA